MKQQQKEERVKLTDGLHSEGDLLETQQRSKTFARKGDFGGGGFRHRQALT